MLKKIVLYVLCWLTSAAFALDYEKTIYVPMFNIGITDNQSVNHILATSGAGPCFAIAIYNKFTQTAALAHVASYLELKNLAEKLQIISNGQEKSLFITLAGDTDLNLQLFNLLQQMLDESPYKGSLERVYKPNIAIDSRDGSLDYSFFPTQILLNNAEKKQHLTLLL